MIMRVEMQRVVQEMLEAEQRDFLGIDRYERGGMRNVRRNGDEAAHVETGEGRIAMHASQVRGSDRPFECALLGFLKGRTAIVERLVTEMYAHGLSARDVETAFTDATGTCVVSKSAVSEVTERLWTDYQTFRAQRRDGVEVLYLFADGL